MLPPSVVHAFARAAMVNGEAKVKVKVNLPCKLANNNIMAGSGENLAGRQER